MRNLMSRILLTGVFVVGLVAGASAADIVANVAKGRVNELMVRVDTNDPANSAIIVGLLQVAEADAVLEDYDTLDALLAAAGNTEATFTNYARQVQTDAEITAPTPDDTNNRMDADLPDILWSSAGGAANNTLVKLFIAYDPDTTGGDDTTIIPISLQDFSATTDGNDLTATINVFFRAS